MHVDFVLVLALCSLTAGMCPMEQGMDSLMLSGRCYLQSKEKITFVEAEDLCETRLKQHLLFLESPDEVANFKSYFKKDVFWLGVSQIEGRSYWTHYSSNVGTPASFTDWNKAPRNNRHYIVDFIRLAPQQWFEADYAAKYYALCERETDWASMVAGFGPLPSIDETTVETTRKIDTTQPIVTSQFSLIRANITLFEVKTSAGTFLLLCCKMSSYED